VLAFLRDESRAPSPSGARTSVRRGVGSERGLGVFPNASAPLTSCGINPAPRAILRHPPADTVGSSAGLRSGDSGAWSGLRAGPEVGAPMRTSGVLAGEQGGVS